MGDFCPPNTVATVIHPQVCFDGESPEGFIISYGYSKRAIWTDDPVYTSDHGSPVVVDVYNNCIADGAR
jgi:hypothetical protein